MSNYLSNEQLGTVDAAGNLQSPGDDRGTTLLGILWAGAFYFMAMIWFALALIDRWSGPKHERHHGFPSVVAAFVLSTAWPVVMMYLIMNPTVH